MHGYLEESCGCCEKSASVLKAGGLRHQQKRSPRRRDSLERSNKAAKKIDGNIKKMIKMQCKQKRRQKSKRQ
jgi:hypothetical protein